MVKFYPANILILMTKSRFAGTGGVPQVDLPFSSKQQTSLIQKSNAAVPDLPRRRHFKNVL